MAAELFCSVKPAVFMYALGMTQHTVGVENIRCFTVLQLLRGNIGVPGGGIDAIVSNPNLGNVHRGLRKLDSVIVEDLYLNETACFWERPDSPEGDPVKPEDIQTEVIFLPSDSRYAVEKDSRALRRFKRA